MLKPPCGGFKLDENSFFLDKDGVLSVSGNGNVNEDDAIALLADLKVAIPLTDENGVIYTDINNNIIAL